MAGGRSHPFHEGNELRWRILTTGVVRFLGSKPLIESLRLTKWIDGRALLEVPRRGRVVAHDTSLLFTTMSVVPSRTGKFPNPIFFGTHKLQEVTIPSRLPLKNCGLSWGLAFRGCCGRRTTEPLRRCINDPNKFCVRIDTCCRLSIYGPGFRDRGNGTTVLFPEPCSARRHVVTWQLATSSLGRVR